MKATNNAWIIDGKPRSMTYLSYRQYKSAKRDFRRCHRKYADRYLQNQLDEIDRVAEVDSAHFWRLVNARRKISNSNPGTELIFHGENFNTAREINREWAYYFRELCIPTQSDHFNTHFYELVSQEVGRIKTNLQDSTESLTYLVISAEKVESAVKLAHSNKAGGDDGITYEHIKFGGSFLFAFLSKLYTAIV